jgi:hypothetical protein
LLISTFWSGPELPPLTQLAIRSWKAQGHSVNLYVFEPNNAPAGVPEGVKLCCATDVLPYSVLERLIPLVKTKRSPWQQIVSYSDIFRMCLMREGLGFWMDTDVVLFRPFDPDLSQTWFATDGPKTVGVSAMYFPPNDPIVEDFLKVLDRDDLMPHWLGFRRGIVKPSIYNIQRQPFVPTDLGITVFGNDAITRLVRKHHRMTECKSSSTFYHLTASATEGFYEPKEAEALMTQNPKITGLHVHRKTRSSTAPNPDSAYGRMLVRLGMSQDIFPR